MSYLVKPQLRQKIVAYMRRGKEKESILVLHRKKILFFHACMTPTPHCPVFEISDGILVLGFFL